jgi:phenylalanyl-tRNA synthetase beta chain
MVISLSWLKEYIDVPADLGAVSERLTLSGTEVEQVVTQRANFEGVVVAQVVGLRPHPKAQKLLLATIDAGAKPVEVVTGATNLTVGDRVPYAQTGARLGDKRIEARTFMEFRSEGMLCSAIELGLGDDAAGIMVLDQGPSLGTDLRELYPPDTILHLEVKSNRPDLLSHLGIGREIATLFQLPLRRPPIRDGVRGRPASIVTIEAPEGCRRFVGRLVTGVRVGPSPGWMQARLRAVGIRPISNVVDITNYVMLESGQPMHAFDHSLLAQGRLVVRRARPGEQLECLDGKTRTLSSEAMVVADPERAQAIAGIIGGSASSVTERTHDVLLEAATWEPRRIRATARALALRTEASLRFEKGLSPALGLPAVDRATTLLMELAGGKPSSGADVYPDPLRPEPIRITTERLNRVLGVDVPPAQARDILERLEFKADLDQASLIVTPPDFRLDCALPEDVVEEVGRIYGYGRIPSTLPGARQPVADIYQAQDADERVREVLAGLGFDEAVTYPLTDRRHAADVRLPFAASKPALIQNPIAEDRDALRVSLIPGLLRALAVNSRLDQPGTTLFELGTGFWPRSGAGSPVQEVRLLAIAMHVSPGASVSAPAELRKVEAALRLIGERVGGRVIEVRQSHGEGFHPGRTAAIVAGGDEVGLAGEIHPAVVAGFDLAARAVGAEIVLTGLIGDGSHTPKEAPLPRFPGVRRDLTVVIRGQIAAADVLQVIRQQGGYTLRDISMVSEYQGPQLEAGARSLSFRLDFQANDRTLTNEEVAAVQQRIIGGLKERFGAEVRS